MFHFDLLYKASVTACILVALATTGTVLAQDKEAKENPTIKVLGFIELFKTSSLEVAKRLENMGCRYSRNEEVSADSPTFLVESGCFNLPGAPTAEIHFVPAKQSDFAMLVKLVYNKGLGNSAKFADYYDPLVRKYGRPVEEKRAFVGNQFARFRVGGTTIVLEDLHMSFQGTVMYLSNASYDYLPALRQKQSQNHQKRTEDLL